MAVYGWDVLDAGAADAGILSKRIVDPRDDLSPSSCRTTPTGPDSSYCSAPGKGARPAPSWTRRPPWQRPRDGIETLVVVLGANNALGSVRRR